MFAIVYMELLYLFHGKENAGPKSGRYHWCKVCVATTRCRKCRDLPHPFFLFSSGIGEGLAYAYAKDNCGLILVARNMGKNMIKL